MAAPCSRVSPTATSCGETSRASPRMTSTPSERKRSSESLGAIAARRSRTRSMTSSNEKSGTWSRSPQREAWAIVWAARAEAMRALLGTQPVFRQSPPMRCFSMSATRPPRPAVPAAVTRPAVPAPMTITL
jgi:hypothetical protein